MFVVLRDVGKAFHNVWHAGLKCKLLLLGLPPLLEKIFINFLDQKTAKMIIGCESSNEIKLMSGVTSLVLSPTFYTIYKNDLPSAGPGCLDVMYADDVTNFAKQIKTNYENKSGKGNRENKQV